MSAGKLQFAANEGGHGSAPAGRWLQVTAHVDPRFGGICAIMPDLCQALGGSGKVTLAAFCDAGEEAPPALSDILRRFPSGKMRWLRQGSLREELQGLVAGHDGVHIHGLWGEHGAVAAWLARRAGKPYVISAHGMLDPWAAASKAWKKRLYRWLIEDRNLGRASCLHALTPAEARDYRKAGLDNPVAVIPNGVSVPAALHSGIFLARFPRLRNRRVILFLSRLHPKKGLDLLATAWQATSRQHPDAHLVLAGPDSHGLQAGLQARFQAAGLEPQVTFTGMLRGADKWSALAAAELFVLPSYSEGLSVAVLEAMAAGKPVIVSEQCNVPEVGSEGCGWLIPPRVPELEAALQAALAASPDELAQLGKRGRAIAAGRYSWPQVGEQMRNLYGQLVRANRPDPRRAGRGVAA